MLEISLFRFPDAVRLVCSHLLSSAMAFTGFTNTAMEAAVAVAPKAPSEAGSLSSDPSLLEFAQYAKVPVPLTRALIDALGGGEDLSLEDFAFLTEDAVKRAAEGMQVDGVLSTDLRKAQVSKLFHRARQAAAGAGLPVPGVIAPVATPAPVAAQPAPPLMLKQSAYLDQSSEATFALLSPEVIRGLRERYFNLIGDHPASAGRPTDEQLSGLDAKLKGGRVPYVDFAVFGPFDDQAARLRKFTDQVFVQGVLQTRLLHGPANFADWQACFGVFKNALIMLDGATLGALNKYEEGLRQLWLTYGDWAVISQADIAMRSREWTIVHDELVQSGTLPSAKPWGHVMQVTAFGEVTGPRAHWWWLHVVGPLSNKASSSAKAVVERLEQRPSNNTPISASKGASSSGRGQPKAKASGKSKSSEYCFAWNEGNCKQHCPEGRRHACRFCDGPHRGKDCADRKGDGKGKSTGNKKSKNQRKRKAGKGGESAFRP